MPANKDPRNKVGAIVHAVANRALSDHTAKNIFGNVNYAKYFLQGTVVTSGMDKIYSEWTVDDDRMLYNN